MQAPCWNIRSFWSLGLANSISRNLKSFLRVGSFYFSSTQSCILKFLRARKFHFRKYKKNVFGKNVRFFFFFFWCLEISFLKYEKNMRWESSISWDIRSFLIQQLESSAFWNIRNFFGWIFFIFLSLGLKLY